MQLLAHVSGFVSQTVAPQKHIAGTSRFCFSIFSQRFLFKASKKLTQHSPSLNRITPGAGRKLITGFRTSIFWLRFRVISSTATICVLMGIFKVIQGCYSRKVVNGSRSCDRSYDHAKKEIARTIGRKFGRKFTTYLKVSQIDCRCS